MPVEPLQTVLENAFADIGIARETFAPTLKTREVGQVLEAFLPEANSEAAPETITIGEQHADPDQH